MPGFHARRCPAPGHGELTETERGEAVAGYRYFGLEEAAKVVEWLDEQLADANRETDPNFGQHLEIAADARYAVAIPNDETIVVAFEARLKADPDAFVPLF